MFGLLPRSPVRIGDMSVTGRFGQAWSGFWDIGRELIGYLLPSR